MFRSVMKRILGLLILLTSPLFGYQAPLGRILSQRLAVMSETDREIVLVRLHDRGPDLQVRQMDGEKLLSRRSLARRAAVRGTARLIDESDYPLAQSYVAAIAGLGVEVRHQLKWFNAVSVLATKNQISALRQLPFVSSLEIVGRWKKRPDDEILVPAAKTAPARQPAGVSSFNYGASYTQVSQINVPAVHDLGIYGQGIVIGVFDNGVRNPHHQVFDSINIIATHDFVDHKVSVVPNNPNPSFGSHGVMTLSTIGGFRPGSLIGPAFKSSFILARTENDSSETPIEEDNWAAAIEWADSIGVDVTSTSLGYLGFDSPYTSLTWADMNGSTALITVAADHATSLGIVVVNAAGNEGAGDSTHNTLIAPADGDSVITAGAVDASGNRTGFSSIGPTTDIPARIKPDIMALGASDFVASPTDTISYGYASGTSFACPLSAGVAALIRCANPALTPMQVREAMRQTASNSSSPDNFHGWGILDALAAINYYGILPMGTIRGIVFDDYNANGVRDPGEPGIAGVRIRCTGAAAESTLTDANGSFVLDSLPTGSVTVSEVVPGGYNQSAPGTGSYTTQLAFRQDTSGFVFGNYVFNAEIHGMVFNDQNTNGIPDSGETGISGRTITLQGPMSRSVTTDSAGNYAFTGLEAGQYTVRDSIPQGWAQTVPPGNAPYSFILGTNVDTTGINFGVALLPAFTYPVSEGWNLLSLPQDPGNHTVADLYPGAISPAFAYEGSYQSLLSVPNGVGYWLRFGSAQTATIPGTVRLGDTLSLSQNWNLIGSLSYPYAPTSIVDSGGILSSQFFGYSTSYAVTDSLRPHQGYWVKASGPGKISVHIFLPPAARRYAPVPLPARKGEITFTDAAGHHQTLYFTPMRIAENAGAFFELPPLPPPGGFDARFANGSMLFSLPSGAKSASSNLQISSGAYPIRIDWKNPDRTNQASLMTDGRSIRLAKAGTATLTAAPSSLALQVSTDDIPESFALSQNYPNPFNPSTTIRYQIPEVGGTGSDAPVRVSLSVYNMLGQQIAKLVDSEQSPGYKSVGFDAGALPSGIYFYTLTAGTFTETKKMVVMK